MRLALSSLSPDDLVVFDLDNTVLEPKQTLGSDQWWGALVQKNLASGMNEDQAIDAAITDWMKVQKETKVQAVEMDTPSLISNLQKKMIPSFALTARPQEVKNITLLQLRSLKIQFSKVIFLGPKQSKGEVLAEFVKRMSKKPRRIIFIDDKVKHVQSVENAFKKSNITNINYRYGAADPKVKNYNQRIADIEWSYFIHYGILLTDQQAATIKNKGFILHEL